MQLAEAEAAMAIQAYARGHMARALRDELLSERRVAGDAAAAAARAGLEMQHSRAATQLQAFESFVKAAHGDEALDAPMVWRQSGEYPCALCCGQGPSGDGDAYSLSVTQHKALQFGGAILVLCCMLQFLGRLCGMARSARAMMGNSHMHSHSHGG